MKAVSWVAGPLARRGPTPIPRLRLAPIRGLASATWATLRGGELAHAGAIDRFEAEAESFLGTRAAVFLGSARAGMESVLRLRGVVAGDEVVIPSYTAPCVPSLLRSAGFGVRIADVDPQTLTVTAETLARAAGPRTRALLPTHVEGVTAPMAEIASFARERGLVLLEDAAHAFGATVGGAPVGSFGDGAVVSFGKGKHVNALFGGLLSTDDEALARSVRAERDRGGAVSRLRTASASLVQVGISAATHPALYSRTLHPLIRGAMGVGVDLPTWLFEDRATSVDVARLRVRPPEVLASFASQQLASMGRERAARRRAAATLREALASRGLGHQRGADEGDHPLFVTLFHSRRESLRRELLRRGFDTQPTWMRAIVDDEGRADPVAQTAAREGLYLPFHDRFDEDLLPRLLASLDEALAVVGER